MENIKKCKYCKLKEKRGKVRTEKYKEFRKINKFLLGFVVLLFGVVVVLAGLEIGEIGERNELTSQEERVGFSPENVLQNEDFVEYNAIADQENNVLRVRKEISDNWQISGEDNQELEYDGYIVEFKEEPLAVKNKEFENSAMVSPKIKSTSMQRQKDLIKSQQENFKTKAMQIVPEIKIERQFNTVFNGMSIKDVSQQELELLRKDTNVKKITPNYFVYVDLMDSVPLINADDVWQLDAQGNNCAQSGEDCLTGEGVTIGIIDTGVDYTHPDLGNGFVDDNRDFELITQNSLNVRPYYDHDQLFSLNEDRVAYYSEDKIYIYNFNDTSTEEILPGEELRIIKLQLNGDLLIYAAENTSTLEQISLYLYDLNTGENLEVDNFVVPRQNQEDVFDGGMGSIAITDQHIIYLKFDSMEINGSLWEIPNIYVYDIGTHTINKISEDSAYASLPTASGNLVAYSISDPYYCYSKMIIYNLENGEEKVINSADIPNMGPVLQIKDNKLIYVACGGDEHLSAYYLYDLETSEYQRFSFDSMQDLNSGDNQDINTIRFFTIRSWIMKTALTDNLIYFNKNVEANRIIAYDFITNRYVEINPMTISGYFEADNKRVCFISIANKIYCHIYNSSYDYPAGEFNFGDKVLGGYDFYSNDDNPMDEHGHGTHVASTAAGNGILKGVAPDANLVAYKVFGTGSTTDDVIISAIERSVDPNQDGDFSDHLDIISLSLGKRCWMVNYPLDCGPDDDVSGSIDNAVDVGVIAVISAGNDGSSEGTIGSPGTARKAITVGATDKWDSLAWFSSRGSVRWTDVNGVEQILIKPDIVAPGVDICAAKANVVGDTGLECLDQRHFAISGTSMAAPHVSGAAALLKQKHPDWTPHQIKNTLKGSSIDLGLGANEQGKGRVNILDAINLINPPEIFDFSIELPDDKSLANIHDKLQIKGSFPSDYENIIVQYSRESDPNTWHTEGIMIIGNNDIFAEFDPLEANVFGNEYYNFKVSITKNGVTEEEPVKVYFDRDLKKGFPVKIEGRMDIINPNIDDIDGDGYNEIVLGEYSAFGTDELSSIHVVNYLGEQFNLAEMYVRDFINPAIGDVDGDGDKEIVSIVSGTEQGFVDNALYVFDAQGNILYSWEIPEGSVTGVSLGDLDNDGSLEIIGAIERNSLAKVYAWHYYGTPVNGWPVELGQGTILHVLMTPALGDIDKDGYLEVAFTSLNFDFTPEVYIFNHDGTLLEGWPVEAIEGGQGFDVNPSLGDLNGDGYLEIIAEARGGKTFVWDYNGDLFNGWPANSGGWSSASLGNMDDESFIEVVTGANIFDNSGVNLFNYLSNSRFSPLIADVSGDGRMDIVNLDGKEIKAYDLNGPINLWGQPKELAHYTDSNPAIADLDKDEKLDIVAIDDDNYVYVYSLDLADMTKVEWPLYQHDPQHTSCYNCNIPVSAICGDAQINQPNEQCDDGNTQNGDGCSATCGIETHYKVFVTSSTYNGKITYGNYFGISAADMICNAKARDAGYAYSKKWKAWLSSSAQSASQRLYHSPRAYRTKDMNIIANNWNDLVDGRLDNPINLDEKGNLINSGIAWTGTKSDGTASSVNCINWTDNGSINKGLTGSLRESDANRPAWTENEVGLCSSFNRIYCFEQPSCGNGFVDQSNEQCDDGNADNGDGCGTDCRLGSGGGKGSPKDITPPRDSLTA